MKRIQWMLLLVGVFGAGMFVGAAPGSQDMSHQGRVFESPTGTTLRMLLDAENLGGAEIEIGEITIPAGADSGSHPHGSTEIFYMLSGELEHVVDGKSYLLKPGMLGFVRPPDHVTHKVPGAEPARALVIWAPGGEAARVTGRWQRR